LVRGVRGEGPCASATRPRLVVCHLSRAVGVAHVKGATRTRASHRGAACVRVYKRLALPLSRLQLRTVPWHRRGAGASEVSPRSSNCSLGARNEREQTGMGKGRAPCCAKVGLNKGSWTPEEDMRLIAYIQKYGHANWRALPKQAGTYGTGREPRRRAVTACIIPSEHVCM
jgi:hypothetical protein